MGDMATDAFKEGHPDYNRGHLIDPESVEYGDAKICPATEDGKHYLEHSGQIDPKDTLSDPIVHCKRCGRLFRAKWKPEYVSSNGDSVTLPRKVLGLIERKEIGLSAKTMLQYLLGINLLEGEPKFHPRDISDLRRCFRLLQDFPELRERLGEMADVSPQWKALTDRWDELEKSTHPEVLLKEILNG